MFFNQNGCSKTFCTLSCRTLSHHFVTDLPKMLTGRQHELVDLTNQRWGDHFVKCVIFDAKSKTCVLDGPTTRFRTEKSEDESATTGSLKSRCSGRLFQTAAPNSERKMLVWFRQCADGCSHFRYDSAWVIARQHVESSERKDCTRAGNYVCGQCGRHQCVTIGFEI